MIAGRSKGCTDFSELVIDDNDTLEGDETFTIVVGSSVANVTIVDDDGMQVILFHRYFSPNYKLNRFYDLKNNSVCLNFVFFHVKP